MKTNPTPKNLKYESVDIPLLVDLFKGLLVTVAF